MFLILLIHLTLAVDVKLARQVWSLIRKSTRFHYAYNICKIPECMPEVIHYQKEYAIAAGKCMRDVCLKTSNYPTNCDYHDYVAMSYKDEMERIHTLGERFFGVIQSSLARSFRDFTPIPLNEIPDVIYEAAQRTNQRDYALPRSNLEDCAESVSYVLSNLNGNAPTYHKMADLIGDAMASC